MPRQFLKRHLPNAEGILQRPEMRMLGRLLEDPFLLHLNRRSVAGGVAIGLFVAFIPLPVQMVLAALLAIWFRVNLILAVALVWVSNPVTIPPLFYLAYIVGTWITGEPVMLIGFEPTFSWFWHQFSAIWQPLTVGSLAVGSVVSLAGYGAVQIIWRGHVVLQLRRRRRRRARAARRRAKIDRKVK